MPFPILYTFRRCPYAIRARMALVYSKIKVEHREVDLKNKPQEMLNASPKGTVPVLILENGSVIDQSIDIMFWALKQSDPDGWLNEELTDECANLICTNDGPFKFLLDNYKYPQRSEKKEPVYYRDKAEVYLNQLNSLLKRNRYLLAQNITYADIALFPFIRQFSMVDKEWFDHSEYKKLHFWLESIMSSELFTAVMRKIDPNR